MNNLRTEECLGEFETLIKIGQNGLLNNPDEAETIFEQALANLSKLYAINLCWLSQSLILKQDYAKAFEYLKQAERVSPDLHYIYYVMAAMYFSQGDIVSSGRMCQKTLDLEANSISAHQLLAQINLPGPNYHEVIERIQKYLMPHTYLEIGVASGDTLKYAAGNTLAVGIDPNPTINQPLNISTVIYQQTSDLFFKTVDMNSIFGGKLIELAFIDGMHQFEFALNDFINIEKNCYPHSVVLIHDCFPLNEITASRDSITNFWSGDIWKLILCLKEYRPDLCVNTIGASPTGLGLITNLNPQSQVLSNNLTNIHHKYISLEYETLAQDKCGQLNYIDSNWSLIEDILNDVILQK